jgi:dipeptidyl aminopeptidase/acylaminoacyl peptidase
MYILTADGKEASAPVDKAVYFLDIDWSPDGKYLAFSANDQEGVTDIYVVKPDGSDLHRLNNGLTSCHHSDWSPFGTYILYTCYQGGNHIYLSAYNAAGKTTFGTMGHIAIWSPNGLFIAYGDVEDGISIMDEKGTNAHTLVKEDAPFAWSPDGKSIALIYDDQIYLVNVSDGKIRNLTGHNITLPYSNPYGWLSFSPDGNYIVYAFNFLYDCPKVCDLRPSPIFIVEVSTGTRLELVDKGILPFWSPTKTSAIKQLPDCTSGWTRLKAGGQARVMGAPTDPPNRVRSGSSKADDQIGVIYPGTILKVLEGPVCADGLVFWKVASETIPGGSGWTAEGDGKEYYLEPYQP